MLFSFALCLVILYMAWDFNHAVNSQVSAITNSTCARMLTNGIRISP